MSPGPSDFPVHTLPGFLFSFCGIWVLALSTIGFVFLLISKSHQRVRQTSQTILRAAEAQAQAAEEQLPVPCSYCATNIPIDESHCPGCGSPAGVSRAAAAAKASQPQEPTDDGGGSSNLQIWQKVSDGQRTITIVQEIQQDP